MSATTHPFVPEEIMAFVDGELSADRAQSISAHIDQCTKRREAVDALQTTSHSLSQWRVEPLDSLSQKGLLVAASSKGGLKIPSQVQGWLHHPQLLFSRPLPWVFACLLFAFLIGAQLLHQARPSDESIFAKYKVSPTAPPPPAGASVADHAYSQAAGGGAEGSPTATMALKPRGLLHPKTDLRARTQPGSMQDLRKGWIIWCPNPRLNPGR